MSSRSYYSILLRKNQTIDDLPPFASTEIPCPSLLNVLVMPAIAVRYDILLVLCTTILPAVLYSSTISILTVSS